MTVMKFGGTSVKDAAAIKQAIEIIKSRKGKRFVVVSAFSGVTNALVEITRNLDSHEIEKAFEISTYLREKHLKVAANLELGLEKYINLRFRELEKLINAVDIVGEVTDKTRDVIFSQGEILSSCIVSDYAKKSGLNAIHADSRNFIRTDSAFTKAEVDFPATEKELKSFSEKSFAGSDVVICGGFISSDLAGMATTLGRGGSDYSAAIIASVLNASKLEIWTDVDGILTSDPRIVSGAKLIRRLSYAEASELAYFGAKVLHPKTIYPAVSKGIPVYVLNSKNTGSPGTEIVNEQKINNIVKSISSRKGITIINIHSNRMLGAYGFLAEVFEVFKKHRVSVDLITTSEVNISLTIDSEENLDAVVRELEKFSRIELFRNRAIISVIGEGLRNAKGIGARFFGVLKDINISMISLGASEVNLSIIVDEQDCDIALVKLHDEFFSEPDNSIFQAIN